MTVADIKRDMSYDELIGWFYYLSVRPVGWREDDRAYKLLLAQGVKGKPWEFFSSAAIMHENEKENRSDLVASGFLAMLSSNSTGGDKLIYDK